MIFLKIIFFAILAFGDSARASLLRPDWLAGVNEFRKNAGLSGWPKNRQLTAYEIGSGGTPIASDLIDFDHRNNSNRVDIVADARSLPVEDESADVIFSQYFSWASIAAIRERGDGGFSQRAGELSIDHRELANDLKEEHQKIKDVILEMWRVLRPNGIFFMTFPEDEKNRIQETLFLYSEHVKAAKKEGFIVQTLYVGDLVLPTSRMNYGLAFIKPFDGCERALRNLSAEQAGE
jgi:SAM-dependent methyltransferase